MSVWVDDVDAVYRHCIDQNLEVTWPPTDMPWHVREMHVRHPDGHVFPNQPRPRPGLVAAPAGAEPRQGLLKPEGSPPTNRLAVVRTPTSPDRTTHPPPFGTKDAIRSVQASAGPSSNRPAHSTNRTAAAA